MAKVVIISHIPLPYNKIGSWTTLYNNYLQDNHQIDIIICPKPETFYPNINYAFTKQNRLTSKLFGRFSGILKQVRSVVRHDERYVIQIIDNSGLIPELNKFLIKENLRSKCYIQYFYHGFPPMIPAEKSGPFFSAIDEMVFLTHDSRAVHQQSYPILPRKLSIMHNGIDTSKFFRMQPAEKIEARRKYNFSGKIFIWCSQDRPKKGLDVILSAWQKVFDTDRNMTLLVVGCEPREPIEGVVYIGRVPNDELPIYYQMSDAMLFSTLCEEGFGMSLVEALHCGCYCIASATGGVPEVLQYGTLGKLLTEFSDPKVWAQEISEFMSEANRSVEVPVDLYTTEQWNIGMNALISDAKQAITSSNNQV